MSAKETITAENLAASPPRRRWPLISVLLLLVVGASAGGAWYAGLLPSSGTLVDPDEPRVDRRTPIYHTLDNNLVVNFAATERGRARYLQVGIELMTRDPAVINALVVHNAVIRNNLIMLLGDQSEDELMSREGKEALQQAALDEIRGILLDRLGRPGVEALYFTSFVMQ
jgi:flagellar FliL protein